MATPRRLLLRRWRRRAVRLGVLVGLPAALLYSAALYDEITRPAGMPPLLDRLTDTAAIGGALDQAITRVETEVDDITGGVQDIYRRLVGNVAEVGRTPIPPPAAARAPASSPRRRRRRARPRCRRNRSLPKPEPNPRPRPGRPRPACRARRPRRPRCHRPVPSRTEARPGPDLPPPAAVARRPVPGAAAPPEPAPVAPPARLAAAAPPDPAAVAIVLEDPAPLRVAAAATRPVLVDRARTRPPAAAEISVTSGAAPRSRAERLRSANAALLAGRPDRAATLYREVLAARRDDPDALFGLGAALQRLGEADEARAAYDRLLAVQPQHHAALTDLMGLIGNSDPAQAIARLEDLHRSNPGFTPILAQLAALHAGQGQVDRALALLLQAAEMNPGNPFYLYNLAVLYDRTGRAADAAATYRRVLELAAAGGTEARALPLAEIRARLDFLTR